LRIIPITIVVVSPIGHLRTHAEVAPEQADRA
jgi:hypothetical protein